MKSKPDGAGVSHSHPLSTPHMRVLMTEPEEAQESESIRWTHTAHESSATLRRDRISIRAYYLSEARGFTPGHDAEDWLLAQTPIDAIDAETSAGSGGLS